MILIVEDNRLNLELMREVLQIRGHRVIEAVSVEEARAVLASTVPDAVLTDIGLPGGGGEAVLAFIRADPRLAALPVAAVTAFAMQGDRERFLSLGFDRYVSKPIDVRAFGPEVESMLASKR